MNATSIAAAAPAQPAAAKPNATKATTTAAFRQDVVAESMRVPVMVAFWAAGSEPSKALILVIERAVSAAAGKIRLVTMNIDEHPEIAGQLGVQSIPAAIVFQRGQPVDGFVGSLPEAQVRGFIERLVGPIASANADVVLEAAALYRDGDLGAAAQLFAEVLLDEPDHPKALAGLARIHLDAGEIDEAKALLASASPKSLKDADMIAVQALTEIVGQTSSIGDIDGLEQAVARSPLDHKARFDLALALNGQGRREEAATALLEIIRISRTWEEDGARKQLVQFFDAWGPMDAATVSARRRLSSLLFA